MPQQLTILVSPLDCVGHVNACAGATQTFLERGHRVIFLLENAFAGKLAALGFEEELYQMKVDEETNERAVGEAWASKLLDTGVLGPSPSPEARLQALLNVFHSTPRALETVKQTDIILKAVIDKIKPDLIWIDAMYLCPSIAYSGIPWILNMSITPTIWMALLVDELPPHGSGWPANAPRDARWRAFKELNRVFKTSTPMNDYIEACGYPRYPGDIMLPIEEALLTVYAFPEEYNYPSIRETGWFNLEVFNKTPMAKGTVAYAQLKSIVPESFFTDNLAGSWSGKWIYLSLGSMGSVDLSLMRRLLDAISSAKHKFIVSLGPRAAELTSFVPANAWGAQYLPQTVLIPQMDLVITHGGNNTVTETFAQGVPMLVLPLFGDQHDNAQRLNVLGLGRRLDPYSFKKEELLGAIESILNDESLKAKVKAASERIQSSRKHQELAETVEVLLLNAKQVSK